MFLIPVFPQVHSKMLSIQLIYLPLVCLLGWLVQFNSKSNSSTLQSYSPMVCTVYQYKFKTHYDKCLWREVSSYMTWQKGSSLCTWKAEVWEQIEEPSILARSASPQPALAEENVSTSAEESPRMSPWAKLFWTERVDCLVEWDTLEDTRKEHFRIASKNIMRWLEGTKHEKREESRLNKQGKGMSKGLKRVSNVKKCLVGSCCASHQFSLSCLLIKLHFQLFSYIKGFSLVCMCVWRSTCQQRVSQGSLSACPPVCKQLKRLVSLHVELVLKPVCD